MNIFLYLQARVHRTNVRVYSKRLPTFFSWKRSSENRREKNNFYTVTEANERTAHFSSPERAKKNFPWKRRTLRKLLSIEWAFGQWKLYQGAERKKKIWDEKSFLTLVLQSR